MLTVERFFNFSEKEQKSVMDNIFSYVVVPPMIVNQRSEKGLTRKRCGRSFWHIQMMPISFKLDPKTELGLLSHRRDCSTNGGGSQNARGPILWG